MALQSRRRGGNGLDIWPGYVDALSTLLMVTIFVLLVFVLAEAFLSAALSGSDKTISTLRGEVAQLSHVLALEKSKTASLQDELASMASLVRATKAKNAALETAQAANATQLAGQVKLNATALREVSLLDQQIAALRLQLATLAAALNAAQQKDQAQHVQIADLGRRLNEALARKVQKLQLYRSEFFGELRKALTGEKNIKIVGDRFVFESAVLFPSDSARLSGAGKQEIAAVAKAIEKIAPKIPPHLNWVLSVAGYADKEAIKGGRYKNNFDLSAARALSVLHLLIADGVPKNRVIASAFGSNHPIAAGNAPNDLAKNRRIEFRLTSAD
ncbi:peptidoglycan -binding protein [Acidiphilium sp. AL]|uniref:Peptidoglycan -binding protein n=1 Tax=Acidiphilium iwatense TaxID=768198 RepID=A0ABS9DU03_9PROT|nr:MULTISPECIES: peptidoglycan -binding protein [Acidiphilium]MCF3946202.1 peptidoglycan -binding protein [Acidiphilium iwatense]MCU4158774.1 peptidoglycan -binding protein [Acidiphilium sp. AL]